MNSSLANNFDFEDDLNRKRRTNKLVRLIRKEGQDFEFYPTTQEQIKLIRDDLRKQKDPYSTEDKLHLSVLDIGAGDGRVLMQLTDGSKYAIEKSQPLVDAMDTDIFVIGSDLFQSTLLDKSCDVVFSNPPYEQYEEFSTKIIKEANTAVIYLILPCRWKDNLQIKLALEYRHVTKNTYVLGSFDYYDADRKARAKVDVIRIELGSISRHHSYKSDPFSKWFDDNFPIQGEKTAASEWVQRREMEEEVRKSFAGEMTTKRGVIPVLAELYQSDLDKLMETYQAITRIPYDLIKELNISTEGVKSGLKLKITSLKDVYWKKLFDELTSITDKLTSETRAKLLKKLTSSTSVDFNHENAVNVVIWAIKQSNLYTDEQIISVFESLTENANIELYKSNQRVISKQGWRYTREDIKLLGEYKLDYRLVLHKCGGYSPPDYNCRGLNANAVNILNDLCVIARNLGFDVNTTAAHLRDVESGKLEIFTFIDKDGHEKTLFDVRAYKKGNMHIRLNMSFIQKLNVVHGKLKGWIKTSADAVREMDIPAEIAEEALNVNMRIGSSHILRLTHQGG